MKPILPLLAEYGTQMYSFLLAACFFKITDLLSERLLRALVVFALTICVTVTVYTV